MPRNEVSPLTVDKSSPAKFFSFWYYQYLLHSGLYMLESWERTVFSILVKIFR